MEQADNLIVVFENDGIFHHSSLSFYIDDVSFQYIYTLHNRSVIKELFFPDQILNL